MGKFWITTEQIAKLNSTYAEDRLKVLIEVIEKQELTLDIKKKFKEIVSPKAWNTMDKACKNCHRLSLKAGGCTATCAIQKIGNLGISMLIADIILNTLGTTLNKADTKQNRKV